MGIIIYSWFKQFNSRYTYIYILYILNALIYTHLIFDETSYYHQYTGICDISIILTTNC